MATAARDLLWVERGVRRVMTDIRELLESPSEHGAVKVDCDALEGHLAHLERRIAFLRWLRDHRR